MTIETKFSPVMEERLKAVIQELKDDEACVFVITEEHIYQNLEGDYVLITINISVTDVDRFVDYLIENQVSLGINHLTDNMPADEIYDNLDYALRLSPDTKAGAPREANGVEYDYDSIDWAIQ